MRKPETEESRKDRLLSVGSRVARGPNAILDSWMQQRRLALPFTACDGSRDVDRGAIAVTPENGIAGREIRKTSDNTGPHDRQSEGEADEDLLHATASTINMETVSFPQRMSRADGDGHGATRKSTRPAGLEVPGDAHAESVMGRRITGRRRIGVAEIIAGDANLQ